MKKISRLLLLLALVCTLLVCGMMSASAENTTLTEGYYTYTVTDGEATITDVDAAISGEVTIPENLGGYPVTAIGDDALKHNASITGIVIPEGVVSVGARAFRSCANLTSATLPDSLVNLGKEAFAYTKLKSIDIPDKVEIIQLGTFGYCYHLEDVVLGEGVEIIDNSAFSQCCSLKSINIPASVKEINEYYNFDVVMNIEGFDVDENNECYSNDEYGVLFNKDKTTLIAYAGGNNLTEYSIPESVTTIWDSAFCGANTLEKLTFLSDSTGGVIGNLYTPALKEIVIDEDISSFTKEIGFVFPVDVYVLGMETDLTESYICHSTITAETITQSEFVALQVETWEKIKEDPDYEMEDISIYFNMYEESIPYGTIYCHEGSKAETYATDNGIDCVLTHFYGDNEWVYDWENYVKTRKCNYCDEVETEELEKTTTDGVEIVESVDPDTTFTVENIADEADERYTLVVESLESYEGEATVETVYDITLENSEGVTVQPDGNVQVKLPVAEAHSNYKVFRVNDDGTYTDMNATVVDGYVVFVTDHFSLYVVVDTSEKACEHEFDYTKSEANLTRPTGTQNGYYTFTCSLCGATETQEVKKADYTEYQLMETRLGLIIFNENYPVNVRQKLLADLQAYAIDYRDNFIESEQNILDAYVAHFAPIAEKAENCIAGKHLFTKYNEETAPKCDINGLEKSTCDYCGAEDERTIPALTHQRNTVAGKAPTCSATGLTEGVICTVCGKTLTAQREISKVDHKDKNGDYKCDYGCGHEFPKPTPDTCDCNCHKSGFMGFIYKIQRFFWKLFKTNKICDCGVTHY